MSHHDKCIRSDGDWFCAAACTHDRDEAHAHIVRERDILLEAAKEMVETLKAPAHTHHVVKNKRLCAAMAQLEVATMIGKIQVERCLTDDCDNLRVDGWRWCRKCLDSDK